jgi:hypothetical protein
MYCGCRYSSQYSDSLLAGMSGNRIPGERGRSFSSLIHTSLRDYTPSYKMGTGYVPGVKRQERGVDHPLHLAAELKKEYSYISTSLLGLHFLLYGAICVYMNLLFLTHSPEYIASFCKSLTSLTE